MFWTGGLPIEELYNPAANVAHCSQNSCVKPLHKMPASSSAEGGSRTGQGKGSFNCDCQTGIFHTDDFMLLTSDQYSLASPKLIHPNSCANTL